MKKFFLGLTLISSVSSFASCPKLVGDFKTCKVKEASIMGMEISAQELRQMPELASVIADTIKVEQSLEGKNTKYTITSTDMDAEEGVIEYVISKPTITLSSLI
ncbi:MAG: hypothetical protein N4A33_04865 [Bacteriovoracaceae bacterium]|jgi:hypothetical protein|nr:hypothetical protein [Bacteriovoracaceae bacterium]